MEIPHTGHLWQVDWDGFGTQAVWQPFRPWTIEHKRACKHFFILWICFKNVLVLLTYPHHISNDWESNVLRSTDAAHDWNILIKTAAKSNIKRISQLPKYFFWPLLRPHRFWTTKKLLVAQRGGTKRHFWQLRTLFTSPASIRKCLNATPHLILRCVFIKPGGWGHVP